MKKLMGFLAVLYLFINSSAVSGDVYLLEINSSAQLDRVQEIVDHAHGRMGDKFVVELGEDQLRRLQNAGIVVEFVAPDFNPDRLYLISRKHPDIPKTAIHYEPLSTVDNQQLVDMSRSDIDILRKEGYMAIPVGHWETPFFYHPPAFGTPSQDGYPSDTLADLVSQDSLYNYDTRLEDFNTRYIYSDSIYPARDWLVSKFREFGYDSVYTDTFYFDGAFCHNVICYKEGSAEPDKLIVVGGHYDSINQQSNPMIFAPGADDNASGTAVALEVARILKDVQTNKSFMFSAFSAEEVGLVGSYFMAEQLYYEGADIEYMANFDMVAFTLDYYDNVALYRGSQPWTTNVFYDAAYRVSDLIPEPRGQAGNSDHASFDHFGYPVAYVQEGDFNILGWHTDIDISERLDFPYFEQLVRMSVAAIAHVDKAAHMTPIEAVYDVGDGQGLKVVWGDCDATYTYKVLYGTASGDYTDTLDASSPPCSYILSGLTEGQTYYLTVLGINTEGYGPLYLLESSGASYVVPRMPSNVAAEPEYQKIALSWEENKELDLDHYRVLRRPVGGSWEIINSSLTDTVYEDLAVQPHIEYEYVVLAVDSDLNESDTSEVASAVPATFDLPILFVDETSSSGPLNPSEEEQDAYYDAIFGDRPYDKVKLDQPDDAISRSLGGQYGCIFWLDDDQAYQSIDESVDSLDWFMGYNTSFFLGGYYTVSWVATLPLLSPGGFFYDNFGITDVADNNSLDFIGAFGQNGWPDVRTSSNNPYSGYLPGISIFEALPDAKVIYTFNSNSLNPDFHDKPAGVAYETPQGKRILLSFPVYHLRLSDAKALLTKALAYFDLKVYGDANSDYSLNMLDILYIIAYLYKGGQEPSDPNLADVDGSCAIDMQDILYLVSYFYKGGPVPIAGCVVK